MKPSPVPEPPSAAASGDLEPSIRRIGERLFAQMEAAEPPSLFSRKGLYGSMMEWSMKDENFKTQLFRFVDVLPALRSSKEVTRHLQEYLGADEVKLSPALRLGLTAAGGVSWLLGTGVRSQVAAMARQFMLGDDPKEIATILRRLHDEGSGFTLDVLGETVVSEAEADHYAATYAKLMEHLAAEVAQWPHPAAANDSPRGPVPALNLSVKISAFYSQIHPTDPATAIEAISARLRPLLRRAKELGAFVNFDMEHYGLKNLTLDLFESLYGEPEFSNGPACGLAMQAYLRDCETDLRRIIAWSSRHRRVAVRLVKGAYWDYETIMAAQRHWPVPVFDQKWESDANYERLTRLLLENDAVVDSAFGTHNVRSIAHAMACAEQLRLDPRAFEFQMLYGMAEPVKQAVQASGYRLRQYCPAGELLPGIAYFVRRLLENTSNEGFLASKFALGASAQDLLRSPAELASPAPVPGKATPSFRNEPLTDFTHPPARQRIIGALDRLRANLGARHPLIINNKRVNTQEWLPSTNPAHEDEVIGHAAQGEISHAEQAVQAATAALAQWSTTPAAERAALLTRTAELMRRDRDDLYALEILEAGKNWMEADADVVEAIDFCEYYARVMQDLAAHRTTQRVAGESNRQHWWPRGVALVIAPWNFPLAILTGMTVAAIVTGNTAVIKPSDLTPVIGAKLMDLLMEAGLPPGVANLLTGPGSKIGAHLVAHPAVDLIAFTGSKEVGLRIWETAARTPSGQGNLKKVISEMGGKNCVIVDADADLDEAVSGCLASAFGYQGQKCSALSRLIVLQDNYDRFLERLVAAAASMRIGPADLPGNLVGPVINRHAQERILKVIEQGKREVRMLWQGCVPDEPRACYVPPTIFAEVPADNRLFREEIFGPVLSITRARDFDEAIRLANDTEFALTGGCYSRSPGHIERVKEELLCGNLYINRGITGAVVERQPFGGFKMSGGGTKAGGAEYLQNFLVPRVITENCLRRGFAPADS